MAILGCREKVKHPERNFFEAEELRHILEGSGLEIVEMASAPALACGLRKQMDLIEKNEIFRGPRITLFNTSLPLRVAEVNS